MNEDIDLMKTKLEAVEKENKLLQQLDALQNENESLKQQNKSLKSESCAREKELKTLKQKLSATEQASINEHSYEFWKEVDDKMMYDPDYIKSLIKNKTITMKETNNRGETLLMLAANRGAYEIARLCINLGADINQKDNNGHAAMWWAVESAFYYNIEQLLLFNTIDANIGDRIRNTADTMNKQKGIIENIMNELNKCDEKQRESFQNTLKHIMMEIIKKKLVFSDDILNICWKLEEMKGNPLKSDLWKCINQTCDDIINGRNKRDWFWLKTCIIPSKIWYINVRDVKKEENKSYLYYKLLKLVEGEAQNQLDLLEQNLKTDAETDRKKGDDSWNKLIKHDVPNDKLIQLTNIRQDNIPNGVTSQYSYNQLSEEQASNANFNAHKFYDYNDYLSKISLLAQMVDDQFQKSIKNIFNIDRFTNIGKIGNNDDDEKKHDDDNGDMICQYMRGPVKLMERARAKAENDYFDEEYPTSACILDLNRCSLIFNDIKTLLFALQLFVNKVNYFQSGCIIGIVRCKNGFIEYIKQKQYSDIKLNVIIKGKTNNLIGEVQFLLETMVNFKKRAHNLYNVEREEEYITNSVSKVLPILLDEAKQIKTAGQSGDVKKLCSLMVNNNKSVSDIVSIDQESKESILKAMCCKGRKKAFLFLKSLMTENEFVNLLFTPNTYGITPIEYSIWYKQLAILKEICNIHGVKQRWKSSFSRALNWGYKRSNDIEKLLNEMHG